MVNKSGILPLQTADETCNGPQFRKMFLGMPTAVKNKLSIGF